MKERRKHCTNKVQKEIFNSILLVVTKKKGGPIGLSTNRCVWNHGS